MNAHSHDHDGQLGSVPALDFEPAYYHLRHYIGWARDGDAAWPSIAPAAARRCCVRRSPPACASSSPASSAGPRRLERRLKRWHKTGQFCPLCRAARA